MKFKFSDDVVTALQHFGTIGNSISINIVNGLPLYASNENKTLVVQAKVTQEYPDNFSIYNIKQLTSIINLFKKANIEYDVVIDGNKLVFTSEDGKTVQEMYLADPDMIEETSANPKKSSSFFADDFPYTNSFHLSEAEFELFKQGLATNGSNTIGFTAKAGEPINMTCSDVDDRGSEENTAKFAMEMKSTSDVDFRIGFTKECMVMLSGDYTIKMDENIILFEGEVFSYIVQLTAWSEMDS